MTAPGNPPPAPRIRVAGYGGCMLGGVPFRPEESFLALALRNPAVATLDLDAAEVAVLGGFPAPRAAKHLQTRVLARQPDIVVIQFGSTDTAAPLLPLSQTVGGPPANIPTAPARAIDRCQWAAAGALATVLRRPPVTPRPDYVAAILRMACDTVARRAVPIVVSPFVFGSVRSNASARAAAAILRAEIARVPGASFLDAHAELSAHPRARVLCRDGFHLSRFGHAVVGAALAPLVAEAATRRQTVAPFSLRG